MPESIAPPAFIGAAPAFRQLFARPATPGREKTGLDDLRELPARAYPARQGRGPARSEAAEVQAQAQERAYRETARLMLSGPGSGSLETVEAQGPGLPLNPGVPAPRSMTADGRQGESVLRPGEAAAGSSGAERRSSGTGAERRPLGVGAERPGAGRAENTGGEEARGPERAFMGGASGAAAGDGAGREEQDGTGASDGEKKKREGAGPRELDEQEQAEVRELKKRDLEVRTHEQAHMSAGGGLVNGGPAYQRERGPDGAMYAVGGEVSIDTSKGSTPDETIARARRVKAAALAPAEPSSQDRQVAAQAAQMEAQARAEKAAGGEEESGAAAEAGQTGQDGQTGQAGQDGESPAISGEQARGEPYSPTSKAPEKPGAEAANDAAASDGDATGDNATGAAPTNGMKRRAGLFYERASAERAPFRHKHFSQAV